MALKQIMEDVFKRMVNIASNHEMPRAEAATALQSISDAAQATLADLDNIRDKALADLRARREAADASLNGSNAGPSA